MDIGNWDRVGRIFDEAADLNGAERDAALAAACGSDAALRAEVETLLAQHARAGVLERLAPQVASHVLAALPDELTPGARIGPYRLLERIGHGGMGVVYLAERHEGEFRQRVALKVLRAGVHTVLLERFLAERRILARLEHPNITRLLDGGITDDGAPYFAMEYVRGTSIVAYAEARRLTIPERVQLLVTLCEAMHYAHRHLVVHRDLKPSNVMVTDDGVVKVLDFGIAKLLDEPDGRSLTGTGQMWMTPEYASPEQVLGLPITAATDVHALGVLSYELLAGQRPFEVDAGAPHAVGTAIVEREPTRPSAVVTAAIATARQTSLRRLRGQLGGDLDTIVLKALDKEPDRRYGTAGEMGDDLRRHLTGRPIQAKPATPAYRLRKFLRRNRVGVAAVATTTLAIAGGVFSTLETREHTVAERQRAEQVTRFVLDLFRAADPAQAVGRDITASELLDSGRVRLSRTLPDQPATRAAMLEVLSRSYAGLGRYDDALATAHEAVSLERARTPQDPLALGRALQALADAHARRGRFDSVSTVAAEVLALRRRVLRSPDSLIASALNDVAGGHMGAGRLDSAEVWYRAAIAEWSAVPGAVPKLAETQANLGVLLSRRGRYDEAERIQRGVLEVVRRHHPPDHPDVALAHNNLGVTLFRANRPAEARAPIAEALAIRTRVLGASHPLVASTRKNLASIIERAGDLDSAAALLVATLRDEEAALGPDHPSIATTVNNLGLLRKRMGDAAGAESLLVRSLDIRRRLLGPSHLDLASAELNLGVLLVQTGRAARGEEHIRRALEIRRAQLPADHAQVREAEDALRRARHGINH